MIGFVYQIPTLCLVQLDSCFFDANLAYMLSLHTNLFPLKVDLQVANELFNCNWCYLTKIVDVENVNVRVFQYFKLLADFIQCDSNLNGFC